MLKSVNDLIFFKSSKQDKLLDICKRLIETKLGWGSPELWTNQHYEKLSLRIIEETDMHVSIKELKQLWGKIRDEDPPDKTLDALAKFAGHQNWKLFAIHLLEAKSVTTEPINSHHGAKLTSNAKWKLLLVTMLILLSVMLFFMIVF